MGSPRVCRASFLLLSRSGPRPVSSRTNGVSALGSAARLSSRSPSLIPMSYCPPLAPMAPAFWSARLAPRPPIFFWTTRIAQCPRPSRVELTARPSRICGVTRQDRPRSAMFSPGLCERFRAPPTSTRTSPSTIGRPQLWPPGKTASSRSTGGTAIACRMATRACEACIAGLDLSTSAIDIYRALMDSICFGSALDRRPVPRGEFARRSHRADERAREEQSVPASDHVGCSRTNHTRARDRQPDLRRRGDPRRCRREALLQFSRRRRHIWARGFDAHEPDPARATAYRKIYQTYQNLSASPDVRNSVRVRS